MRKVIAVLILTLAALCLCCFSCLVTLPVAYRLLATPTPELVATPRPTLELTPWPVASPTPQPAISPTPEAEPPPSGEETLQLLLETEVPPRDLYALTARVKGLKEPIPQVVNETLPDFEMGQMVSFWVNDEELSETYFPISATLRVETPHLYVWVEEGLEVDQKDLEEAAWEFEEKIYPTNHRFFGTEWSPGVDNDPHIHILNANLPSVGGYYSSADEYPRIINPFSNEKEMFYINAGYIPPGVEFYRAVLAHEFQHMIHWHSDPNEAGWVNEGLAELASKLNGYWVNLSSFLSRPDTQLNAWADEIEEAGPHYDASYLFLEYFWERFGDDMVRQLVETEADGMAGFDEVLAPYGLTFEDIFQDWVIANYLDDVSLDEGRYGYGDLRVSLFAEDLLYRYPVEGEATVHQYAADYIVLHPSKGDVTVGFQGSPLVKVLANEPHSGRYQWWSNRGDMSDMTLTRRFDLSEVEEATLSLWLWYDIEEDYDYAYIEVSTDGGQTFDTLRGGYTTDANPYGNNWGHGYTGVSGGGEEPQWVKEEIDLTPYVGKEVLIRFEYITDDAYNDPGFAVDDISIPELGYTYDAESGTDDGWEAEGFVRMDNILPQRWSVQVIEFGREETAVRQVPLDEEWRGEYTVEGLGQEVSRAVVVIAAMAPSTTEVAGYRYEVSEVE